MAKKKLICPSCASANRIPIKYGLPGEHMMGEYHAGKIALGGCCVGAEDPRWECLECRPHYGGPPSLTLLARDEGPAIL